MSSKLPVVWLNHLSTQEEIEQFEKDLRAWINTRTGKKFLEIIQQHLEGCTVKEIKLEQYDTPSWACKQAHWNGYRQHVLQVLDLFKFHLNEKTK